MNMKKVRYHGKLRGICECCKNVILNRYRHAKYCVHCAEYITWVKLTCYRKYRGK